MSQTNKDDVHVERKPARKKSVTLSVMTKNLGDIGLSDDNRTPFQERKKVVRENFDWKLISETEFHLIDCENSLVELQVRDADFGLSQKEAEERVKEFGVNELKKSEKLSVFGLFFSHLFGILNIILFIAAIGAIVSAAITQSTDFIEGIVILVIIVFNTMIGFFQEYKSERTLQSLMEKAKPIAIVIRNGQRKEIEASELVVGDIVDIADGDIVPADIRLLEAVNLTIDEAFLTGESDPIRKQTHALEESESEALGDRTNLGYMSSVVTKGRGKGIVIATGMNTELGKIAKKLRDPISKTKTNLQRVLSKLAMLLFMSAIILSFIAFGIQLLAIGTDALTDKRSYLFVVSLCVGLIPESLPAVLAVTLSVGMRIMASKHAIVRKLPILETLNWVDVICTDKTGTLTEGKMRVVRVFTSDEQEYKVTGHAIVPENATIVDPSGQSITLSKLNKESPIAKCLYTCTLCNMATVQNHEGEWVATGDSTEVALRVLTLKIQLTKELVEREYSFVSEYPFDSHWKKMSVIYRKNTNSEDCVEEDLLEGNELFLKGSTEAVLKSCSMYLSANGEERITSEYIHRITSVFENYSARGYRVLALAYKDNCQFTSQLNRNQADANATFVGLVGIQDAPRPESRLSVIKAKNMGIDVYMLTGDHKLTAVSIAKQVCIIENELIDGVKLGNEFEKRPYLDNGLMPKVVARCNPNTKIRMIEELHAKKPPHIVCMCGDGVNDVAALKVANVGIAMGDGSEVTRSAADLVLLDSNFATIIDAVLEGRKIYANIEKIILYLMTNNIGAVFLLIGGLVFSFFVSPRYVVFPLSPMQILFLNVVTDTPTCLCLSVAHIPLTDLEKPRDRRTSKSPFSLELIVDVIVYGVLVGVISLASFGFILFRGDLTIQEERFGTTIRYHEYQSRSVAFLTIVYIMLIHSFVVLHKRDLIIQHNFKKKAIVWVVFLGLVIAIPTVYVPYINVYLFKQYSIGLLEWLQVLVCVSIFCIVAEFYKLCKQMSLSLYHFLRSLLGTAEKMVYSLDNIYSALRRGNEERRHAFEPLNKDESG